MDPFPVFQLEPFAAERFYLSFIGRMPAGLSSPVKNHYPLKSDPFWDIETA
jgi:hypothetical protein